ncbi:uncharacterized protein LOC113519125 [Galleria mellonella]|uniref:Uncharacterized protein LOC113519125 n=1 Tax=Galleria mellonella TaxID=7137 RepID=A0A6J3CA34_GALME|nr:uncharacterized protein LOC113519125 [Galleria mellonella]
MFLQACNTILYGVIILSLFLIDYILGNGFVDMSQKMFCKFACFVKRSIREEAKQAFRSENPISLPILFTEIIVLSLTIAFLNKYKKHRGHDRLDELLHESKEALRQTNVFLEKWRLKRVPTDYTYLDDEPQEIKPLKLEVPILHMAIVDTLGTARSQPESGDAGDAINVIDSTLLSSTSMLDEELDSIPDFDWIEDKHVEFRNRFLWDVMEEDANVED